MEVPEKKPIQFKPRVDLAHRTPLQEVIPLQTPFVIFVDPSDRCFFHCPFCPSGDHALIKNIPGRNHFMSLALYQRILEQIEMFPDQLRVLRLYKDGEPLYNPHFFEMVRLARDNKKIKRIDTTTNAFLLQKPKVLESMIEAPLDRVNISIYGVDAVQYQKFCGINMDFDKFYHSILEYCRNKSKSCEVIIKINGDIISETDVKRFIDLFGPWADGIYVEHVMMCWPEYDYAAKNIEPHPTLGIYGQPAQRVEVCPYVFYSMAVNSDGTVSACFLDWQRMLVIGDVLQTTLPEIWHGEIIHEHRLMMLRKQRRFHSTCAKCDQLVRGMPDNIDAYAETLLERI